MSGQVPSVPPGPSTPGGTVRPASQEQSQHTIGTIIANFPNLLSMHSRGDLKEAQILQLRHLMHTHFRQVIAHAMHAGKPNPLLNLPPALDPTMPYGDREPLISRDDYLALISTTTQHLRDAMMQRLQAQAQVQAQAQGQTQGVQDPNFNQNQSNSSNTALPSSIPIPPQQSSSSTQPNNAAVPIPNTVTPTIRPTQIPQGAVSSSGMANINQTTNQKQNTQSNTGGATTAGGATAQPLKIPPGIMNFQTMNTLMKMTLEQRKAWLNQDPARITAFNLSAKYWASRTNANAIAAANKNAAAAASASASGSSPAPAPAPSQSQQQQKQQMPTTIAPKSLLTPPIPQPTQSSTNTISPSALQAAPAAPAPAPQQASKPQTSTEPAGTKPVIQDTKAATSSAPVDQNITKESKGVTQAPTGSTAEGAKTEESKAAQGSTSTSTPAGKSGEAVNGTTGNTADASTKAVAEGASGTTETSQIQTSAAPALPSAINNPEVTAAPAFAIALPDPKAFALKPPPPPPEPENVRRKRKCKEFIGELHPGLEMEYGMDEVIGDILDGLIDEGLKGATRLAKHRKSDKVELKDIAFFVDQCWGIENPGFDALGHTHRKTHIPPERERRKAKAVNPRAARLGRAREEE